MLTLPESVFWCFGLVLCGALARAAGLLSRGDGQVALQLARFLTLPVLCFQVFRNQGFLLDSAIVATLALALQCGACLLAQRAPPQANATARRMQALRSGLITSAESVVLPFAWVAPVWGVAGVEAAAVFAVYHAVFQGAVSYWRFGSGGSARPAKLRHSDGGVYAGETDGTAKEGLGVYRYKSGACYEGYWHDNLKHGAGVYTYTDGSKFEGEFFAGERCGIGVRTLPDGSVRAARFLDGVFDEELQLGDAAGALSAARDAAESARRVHVGRATVPGLLARWHAYPLVLAVAAAVAVCALGLQIPPALDVTFGLIASFHIPLALVGWGAAMEWQRVQPQHRAAVVGLLSTRVICACSLGAVLLLLTPQKLGHIIRAAALVACTMTPAGIDVHESLNRFALPDLFAASVLPASAVVSACLLLPFTFWAWLQGIVPISLGYGLHRLTTEPLFNFCVCGAVVALLLRVLLLRVWARARPKASAVRAPEGTAVSPAAAAAAATNTPQAVSRASVWLNVPQRCRLPWQHVKMRRPVVRARSKPHTLRMHKF